jgi:hypothetical protein
MQDDSTSCWKVIDAISRAFRFFLPLLGFLLMSWAGLAQTIVRGTLFSPDGLPVPGASVIVRQAGGDLLAFALSNPHGAYSVTIPSPPDTLWITISHLAFASVEQKLALQDIPETLDWTLEVQEYMLPEVEFVQPTLTRYGDTLVFHVDQIREIQDETIEQVLSRIPGITIEPDGRILYQDLPISRFYIEGLDLLEGRYTLATRNLNLDVIRDIEILETHQPIRALDSLIMPPNAAINLRLKSNIAITGSAEAGLGMLPGLYLGDGSLFGFQKKQQFHISASAHNVGLLKRYEFKGHYEERVVDRLWVTPTRIQRPFRVETSNVLDNREASGGLNYLRRLGSYSLLKLQAFSAGDHTLYQGQQTRIWRDADSEVRFTEHLNALEALRQINGSLLYELNAPRVYTRVQVESDQSTSNTAADNLINNRTSAEDFGRGLLNFRGRAEAILRKGNKAYQGWSKVSYSEEEVHLLLRPLDLAGGSPSGEQALQRMQIRSLNTDTYTGFVLRRKQSAGYVRAGLRTRWNHLDSELFGQDHTGVPLPFGAVYRNDVRQMLWSPYWEQDISWNRSRGTWKLFIPVSLHLLSLDEASVSETSRERFLVVQPYVEYLPNRGLFSARLAVGRDYNQDALFYRNFLLRSNRFLDRQIFAINRHERYELSGRYQNRSRSSDLFYTSRLSAAVIRADFLPTTVFDTLGQASQPEAISNLRAQGSWRNKLEILRWSYLQIKLETNYTASVSPGNLNGNPVRIHLHQAWAEPYLVLSFHRSVLSCRPRMDLYRSSIAERSVWQAGLRWVFFQRMPDNWGQVQINFDQFQTRIGTQKVRNNLLNLTYKGEIPRWKMNWSLQLNNLTNESHFISFRQEGFSEELSAFSLRPRQVLLSVGKKF